MSCQHCGSRTTHLREPHVAARFSKGDRRIRTSDLPVPSLALVTLPLSYAALICLQLFCDACVCMSLQNTFEYACIYPRQGSNLQSSVQKTDALPIALRGLGLAAILQASGVFCLVIACAGVLAPVACLRRSAHFLIDSRPMYQQLLVAQR